MEDNDRPVDTPSEKGVSEVMETDKIRESSSTTEPDLEIISKTDDIQTSAVIESKSTPKEDSDESEEDTEDEDESSEEKEKGKEIKRKETVTSEYDPANVHYEGEDAIYTDPKSGYQYKWCKETNEWQPKSGAVYGFEDDTHTYTDEEGVKYFWDKEKKAWFPKIDDDFMAQYQMNYGFVDNTSSSEKEEVPKKEEVKKEVPKKGEKGVKRKAPAPEPSKFSHLFYL